MAKPKVENDWVWVGTPSEADIVGLEEDETKRPLKVVFSAPATHWTDAAPVGNGRLGAMVWGGVSSEKLQLNLDTLWTGVPGNYTNPNSPKNLAKVRALVDKGQYYAATTAAYDLSDGPTNVYQPLGDINLDFTDSSESYTSYTRELDLNTATVSITYMTGNVQFTRQHFASNPHQAIVTKISANKPGSISFTVSLTSQLYHDITINTPNQIIMSGICPDKRIPPQETVNETPTGIKFSSVLSILVENGEIKSLDGKSFRIKGADSVILILVASSNFDGPFTKPSDSKLDPLSDASETLNKIKGISYSDLFTYHMDDYKSLFGRVRFEIGDGATGDVASKSTGERIKSFKDDEDPSLVELLFHYGRYLMISCSRSGTQASNLQGIWSKDLQPAWDAAPHLNINLQMNYWPALSCNMRECQEPLFDLISYLSVNGTKTAKVNYEASGWVTHHVSDIWAKTSTSQGDPVWAMWPMGGAWLCTHLWEHYSYTMDKVFLEKTAYPLLESCALFLLDWLIEGKGGYLQTNPSTSPEHPFIAPDGKTASVSYSTTMDMSIIREVFLAVISSAEVLGKSETDFIQKIKSALPKLPPIKVARDGTIMEWAIDFQDPEIHHRHVSHLFGLYPGHTITLEKTPDLCKAVANSLYKRGDEGPGWSTVWKIALWARLHNTEHAYTMVKHLFDLVDPDHETNFEGGLYSNLFTAHPPFQIDANFGFTAGIAEMLVQSTEHELHILPALPRDKWPEGCIKGFKARGGATVNICWKKGELHETVLWYTNTNDQNTLKRLRYDGRIGEVQIARGTVYRFSNELKCVKKWVLDSSP